MENGIGRRTGVVVECGHSITSVVPIVDGRIITEAVMQLDIGGQHLTLYLMTLLKATIPEGTRVHIFF
jgi:actin-related protein